MDVESLYREWPRFAQEIAGDENEFLQRLLPCLAEGVIYSCSLGVEFCGLAAAIKTGSYAAILCLPRRIGREAMTAVRQWARSEEVKHIRIVGTGFNGSDFRYMEKTLGFRRHSVIFQMEL